jgi:prepilin-type N-terminal cleavage/methylation domain-containing protein
MKNSGFTLVELLAVIVILAIILAIAVPSINNIILSSTKSAFESDVKMVLKSLNYKKLDNDNFDETSVTKDNISSLLGISSNNYDSIKVLKDNDTVFISIIGKNKWNGLIACGTSQDIKIVTSLNNCASDFISPTINSTFAGSILYTDPTFANGSNGTFRYNNISNENVTVTRTAINGAPEGSGYGLTIQTVGEASPGYGGFFFATPTSANKIFVNRIVAKIPAGYTINWASNLFGTGGTIEWLTSNAGTGDWKEYMVRVNTGSSGSFSTTNFFYIDGGMAPTTSNPLIWYVAYATVLDTTLSSTTNYIMFTGSDMQSGIAGYGFNQSSTVAPAFTPVASKNKIAGITTAISAKGTYYLWLKDALGNVENTPVTVNYTTN